MAEGGPHLRIHHRDRQESFSGSAGEFEPWITDLKARDERNRKLGNWSALAFVLGLLAVPFLAAAELWTPTLVALVVGVGGLVLYFIMLVSDYEDRKIEVVQALMDTFAAELDPARSVDIEIDFRAYGHFERGQPWLTVQMVLGNGVSVRLQGFHRHKVKLKEKPPRSNPYRPGYTKEIVTITERLTIRLTAPKGRTWNPATALPEGSLPVGRLELLRTRLAARSATFVFDSRPLVIIHRRNRVNDGNYLEHVPQGEDAVRALIVAYHLLGRAGAKAVASA